MIFILITVFIDMLGIGIIIPILPELIREFVGGSSALAGRWYGVLAATYAVTQFVFAPLLGALSDRVGRRPVILISLFGLGIDYLIMGFAPTIGWLFAGRLIAGVMGANATTANAYIADVSKPENRARNFGLIGVAFGLGFIFGPAIGGLLGSIDLRLPFFASAGLALLNWLYGFFVLPESLPPEKRDVFRWRKANPVGSLHVLRTYPLVAGLTAAFVFVILAQRGLETVWVLYTGHKFGWDERANGLSLALVGIMSAIVQGGLVQPVIQAHRRTPGGPLRPHLGSGRVSWLRVGHGGVDAARLHRLRLDLGRGGSGDPEPCGGRGPSRGPGQGPGRHPVPHEPHQHRGAPDLHGRGCSATSPRRAHRSSCPGRRSLLGAVSVRAGVLVGAEAVPADAGVGGSSSTVTDRWGFCREIVGPVP